MSVLNAFIVKIYTVRYFCSWLQPISVLPAWQPHFTLGVMSCVQTWHRYTERENAVIIDFQWTLTAQGIWKLFQTCCSDVKLFEYICLKKPEISVFFFCCLSTVHVWMCPNACKAPQLTPKVKVNFSNYSCIQTNVPFKMWWELHAAHQKLSSRPTSINSSVSESGEL